MVYDDVLIFAIFIGFIFGIVFNVIEFNEPSCVLIINIIKLIIVVIISTCIMLNFIYCSYLLVFAFTIFLCDTFARLIHHIKMLQKQ